MRGFPLVLFAMSFFLISSCVGKENEKKDCAVELDMTDTITKSDTFNTDTILVQTDTLDQTDTLTDAKPTTGKMEDGTPYSIEVISVGEGGGVLKRLTYTLYEIEFYPPGLKEAYESYMQRDNYAEKARKYKYHSLVIHGDVVIYNSISELVRVGDLLNKKDNAIGYVTLNGMDFKVYDASEGEYKHIIRNRKNPRTFTLEYIHYPELKNEVVSYPGSYTIFGALDLENIPKVGEEINDDEEIKYVFYKDWNMLWEKREREMQSKAASEAKDTLGTDSVASDNPVEEEQNDN